MLPKEGINLNLKIPRCIGVYFPKSLKKRRRNRIMIAMSWIAPFLFLILTLAEVWGFHGLECRTRKCTILHLPGEKDPKQAVGQATVLSTLVLLVVFNLAIYIKLKVSVDCNCTRLWLYHYKRTVSSFTLL